MSDKQKDEIDLPAMRYFIDGTEVTEAEAREAENLGKAQVVRGGSGVVPTVLRQGIETREQWSRPWVSLVSRPDSRCMDCGHVGPSHEGDCDRCGGPAQPLTRPADGGGA